MSAKVIKEIKTKRGSNYTELDKNLLLDCVKEHVNVIENKRTDGTTARAKDEAWEKVCGQFNSRTSSARTTASLRKCYENLKKFTRKRASNERMEIFKTGGGRPKTIKMDAITERVRAIIKPTTVSLSCSVDSDAEYITLTDRIKPKPSETIGVISSSKHTGTVLASADQRGVVTVAEYQTDDFQSQKTGLEDDDEFSELMTSSPRKLSDWTQGTAKKLWEPISETLATTANASSRIRHRTPALRPIAPATAETSQTFGNLDETKLELTQLHIFYLNQQIERGNIEGNLQKQILEVELATKKAILEQELLKLANLHRKK